MLLAVFNVVDPDTPPRDLDALTAMTQDLLADTGYSGYSQATPSPSRSSAAR